MNHEFLKLVQMVEAGRKCEGRECVEITDADVAQAEVIDRMEDGHRHEQAVESHLEWECAACIDGTKAQVVLRESLHIRGIDFPEDVFRAR